MKKLLALLLALAMLLSMAACAVEEIPTEPSENATTQPTETEATEPTEPPVTEPAPTEPPVTEPPATEPPMTEPPATEPPVTEPPATNPPATEPPHTHQYSEKVTAPTCTETGYTTFTCSCGYSYQGDTVNPSGHTEVVDPAAAATCTQTGLTEGKHCIVCGVVTVVQSIVPAPGHTFLNDETGKTQICSVCNYAPEASGIPILEIFTENNAPILDKENYIKCKITVGNSTYELTEASAGIRGRGNSTWGMPKKPYRIKFDQKTDFFGNGAAKNWTLIANYSDKSMLRNYLAYRFGSIMESIADTTTTAQFVDLYLNGIYQGVYLVCEQMETGTNRVDIRDDINEFGPEDIGYLLELDARAPDEGTQDTDYISVNGAPHAIKSPDYEDLERNDVSWSDYVAYIKSCMQQSVDALNAGEYNRVKECLNVDSFAESYIVHELMHMVDVGYSSFYLYKGEDGKLTSGPLWDFDISSGNCNYHSNGIDPNYLWAKSSNPWYNKLLEYPEFQQLVAEKLARYKAEIKVIIDSSMDFALSMEDSFNRNFQLWKILNKYIWPNPDELVAINTWQGQVAYLQNWLTQSLNHLLTVYA